jgi:excinuclease ABC subunit A
LGFLIEVGLEYLTLDRPTRTLSGGEAQRIRLATQIGSKLRGITYILDEPTIGLHQRDNERLIAALHDLVDTGNTVLVVEHDKEMMLAADHIVDLGPGAGEHGGEVTGPLSPKGGIWSDSLTSQYLMGKHTIPVPKTRREGNGHHLILTGATGNNLQQVSVKIPLGTFTCVTGVSGSGKSSLINETLWPILRRHFYNSSARPLPYQNVAGLEHIDKVIEIDQSPIGRTPRSNPATYTGVFNDIRKLFAEVPEARVRGYKPGRFSFNVKGGRCEECQGAGVRIIKMNFLPDVQVHCERCLGRRYNRETLDITYHGKTISDVLEMPIEEAVVFFENVPFIRRKLQTLVDVGQQSTTLSGGEAQRVKLAEELSKRDTGKTFYILDEPTTGLHFEDVRMLLDVLNRLVEHGNTVVVIEHNLDVIKVADYIIDLGPEGGSRGGDVVATGTPEQVAQVEASFTGRVLRGELKG